MKNLIGFILLSSVLFSNDYLLQAIYTDWSTKQDASDESVSDSESHESSEAEHYSWELGRPDNEVQPMIIYESSPCESAYY